MFFKQSETRSFTLKVDVPEDINPYDVIRLGVQAGVDRKEIVTEITNPPPPKPGSHSTGSVQTGSVSVDGSYFIGFKDGEFVMGEDGSDPASVKSPIEVSLEADKDEVYPGSLITYSVTIKNVSDETMNNLRIMNTFAGKGTTTWAIDSLSKGKELTKKYHIYTAKDLENGETIIATTEVWSNSVIATTNMQTNVITQAPQAGWGTFSIALNESKKYLSPPAHAASAAPPAHTENETGFAILWIFLIITGLSLGGIIGLKRY